VSRAVGDFLRDVEFNVLASLWAGVSVPSVTDWVMDGRKGFPKGSVGGGVR
jgi:hypothetical protein